MGIKFLRLQMIPWCFHLTVNHVSSVQRRSEPPVRTIKLIKLDGLVKIYNRPINVSELMLEHPKHLVCRSDSFYIGQKIPALSKDDKLELGHKYFLLPKHFFQTVLSFVTIASFASSPSPFSSTSSSKSKNTFLKKAASCKPFEIRKTPSGSLQVHVSDEFISKLIENGKIEEDEEDENSSKLKGRVCTTLQLEKDYTQLVGTRQWKPKLETIRESHEGRKLSRFGMKRRKKAQTKGIQKNQRTEHLHVTSTTTPSKSKTKIKAKKVV